MRWKAIRIATVVAVSGLALVAAGCGSSKKSSAPTTTTTEATTTESTPTTTETTTTTEATTTTESTNSSTTNFAKGPCKDLAQKAQSAMTAAGAKGDVGAAAKALKAVADQAPSEIKGDVVTIADVLQKYADALKSAGYTPGQVPSAAQATRIAAAAQSLQGEQAKLTQAEQHITAWARKNCT
jgi:hypothetical protein